MLGLILVINGLVEVTARELKAMQVDTTRVEVYALYALSHRKS